MIALSPTPEIGHQPRSRLLGSRRLQLFCALSFAFLLWAWTSKRSNDWIRYSLDISVVDTAVHGIPSEKSAGSKDIQSPTSVAIESPSTRPLQDISNIPLGHNRSAEAYHLLNTTASWTVPAYPPLPPADDDEYVAFCLVIKNQSLDMPEFFVHHYHHHGVRRFYVYDDGSDPPLREKPYVTSWGIPDSAITFNYINNETVVDRFNLQVDTYTDCAKRALGKHKWVAWLDPDEFLEMRGQNPPTLVNFLKGWEKNDTVGALGVHWLSHNSNGVQRKQVGQARKAYTQCVDNKPICEPTKASEDAKCPDSVNRHVKTFVRPDRFRRIENIHFAQVIDGTREVNEHGDLIYTWCHSPITHDVWALHHYITKSREDYDIKKGRQRVEGGKLDDNWWIKMHNNWQNVTCPELAAYVP